MEKNPLAIALDYFGAWTGGNIDSAASLIADDATFDMPINEYPDKRSFVQAVEFTASSTSDVRLLAQFGNEQDALLIYDMRMAPIGELRIAEQFRVRDGKIRMIRHIHDTEKLRRAGFAGQSVTP